MLILVKKPGKYNLKEKIRDCNLPCKVLKCNTKKINDWI